MKVLLIERCSDSMLWYRHCVGCYVPYIRTESDVYFGRELAGFANIVQLTDARVVDVDNPKFYTPVRQCTA